MGRETRVIRCVERERRVREWNMYSERKVWLHRHEGEIPVQKAVPPSTHFDQSQERRASRPDDAKENSNGLRAERWAVTPRDDQWEYAEYMKIGAHLKMHLKEGVDWKRRRKMRRRRICDARQETRYWHFWEQSPLRTKGIYPPHSLYIADTLDSLWNVRLETSARMSARSKGTRSDHLGVRGKSDIVSRAVPPPCWICVAIGRIERDSNNAKVDTLKEREGGKIKRERRERRKREKSRKEREKKEKQQNFGWFSLKAGIFELCWILFFDEKMKEK